MILYTNGYTNKHIFTNISQKGHNLGKNENIWKENEEKI